MDLLNLFLKYRKISTDSRKIEKDDIFFALKGPSFDGNKFATKALEQGASFCIIDDEDIISVNEKFILVNDCLKALQQLARDYRKHLGIPTLAITGSNGKTTTKELLANVLSSKFRINYTKGNLNNEIGVPLTILNTNEDDEFLIVEMGANHVGEIAILCEIACPDYGIITNIGKAHLEGFGGIEGVKKGKSELYRYLCNNKGTIFLNEDDVTLVDLIPKSCQYTGYNQSNFKIESYFPFLNINVSGRTLKTNLAGNYNLSNIAAALHIGRYFDIDDQKIFKAISDYLPQNNRSQYDVIGGVKFIKDAYNANPSSVKASLTSLFESGEKDKVVILGDMLELGQYAESEHRQILEFLASKKIFGAIFIGPIFYSFRNEFHGQFYESVEQARQKFDIHNFRDKVVLLKGSRGIALENLLQNLQ